MMLLARKMHKRCGRQWLRRAIVAGYERRDRHCRSPRSTVRSRDRQSCRRDGSRPRSCRPTGRRRCCHSAPTIARGCIEGPDRRQPVGACTIRTRRPAALLKPRADSLSARRWSADSSIAHSSGPQTRSRSPSPRSPRPVAGSGGRRSADNGDEHSADSGDAGFALPHSLQMQKPMHSRQRIYAYCLPSYC